MAAKQGFLMYYSKGDAIGTKVSVRYRRSGRLSGVVVKRGSTVLAFIESGAHLNEYRMLNFTALDFTIYRLSIMHAAINVTPHPPVWG